MISFVRRSFLSVFAFAALVVSAPGFAAEYEEGTHYDVINPAVRVGASDEVVVTEFFWYGCGHCYTFEPMLEAWKKTLPEGSRLQPSPAMWNGPMQLHAKAFYVAEALGVLDSLHPVIFKAMHVERNRLANEDALRELFVANGVDGAEFDKAFNSFGINSQVRQADARARSAKVSGTPSIMVNGKYMITARQAGGQSGMLEVANYLIEKELAALR